MFCLVLGEEGLDDLSFALLGSKLVLADGFGQIVVHSSIHCLLLKHCVFICRAAANVGFLNQLVVLEKVAFTRCNNLSIHFWHAIIHQY